MKHCYCNFLLDKSKFPWTISQMVCIFSNTKHCPNEVNIALFVMLKLSITVYICFTQVPSIFKYFIRLLGSVNE